MTDALPLYRLEIPSHSQTEFIDITPRFVLLSTKAVLPPACALFLSLTLLPD
ncbi:UPF0047 protein Bsu YugU [Dehalococcoides mccartyi]|uniref:UPF0047 protein Bsu YugU n=1 Tax=Dehalococcoides mccartyi TaxID=61435 RepID=A0A328ESV3_9CHLR|nr:UPF0047 protein Bsu YugU [Dehalococcoides mccartyi]